MPGGYVVRDASGQALAYCDGGRGAADRRQHCEAAGLLTREE